MTQQGKSMGSMTILAQKKGEDSMSSPTKNDSKVLLYHITLIS